MERRYHVGRVDGNGPIFKLGTRREAEDRVKELKVGCLPENAEFYIDGPEEDPDPMNEELRQECRNLVRSLQSDKHQEGLDGKMITRLLQLPIMEEIVAVNSAFSRLGVSGHAANAVALLFLGMKLGKAEAERVGLEKMVV